MRNAVVIQKVSWAVC